MSNLHDRAASSGQANDHSKRWLLETSGFAIEPIGLEGVDHDGSIQTIHRSDATSASGARAYAGYPAIDAFGGHGTEAAEAPDARKLVKARSGVCDESKNLSPKLIAEAARRNEKLSGKSHAAPGI